jgi:hypothetical protein
MLRSMRAGWLQFGRNGAAPAASAPDNAVTAPRPWLLCAAIVASTAALLGTSESVPPVSSNFTTYTFERTGIDGGFVELTRDQPTATFLVTVRADALGPEGVMTTDGASMNIDGTITTSGLADGATAPFVSVKLSSPDLSGIAEQLVQESYSQQQSLVFIGDCDTPPGSSPCRARVAVEVARTDDDAANSVVRFDWLLDVHSRVEHPSSATGKVGPLDPPWTVEVTQP